MQGWRNDLDASPREILDLLELIRVRRQSLLRTLLENGTAQVTVRRNPTADNDLNESRTVQLQAPCRASAELAVLDGEEPLGIIETRDHTDILDVLASRACSSVT
jgi:hypothetical protein